MGRLNANPTKCSGIFVGPGSGVQDRQEETGSSARGHGGSETGGVHGWTTEKAKFSFTGKNRGKAFVDYHCN